MTGISFRISDITSSIGVWTAIAIVEIAEKITWDTINFRVYLKMPVGGYAFPPKRYKTENPSTLYLTIVAILTAVFTMIKHKTHKKLRRRSLAGLIFTLMLLSMLLGFNTLFGISEEGDVMIVDFYSCDAQGSPQYYFPVKTTAYFNVSVRNFAQDPKNVSIYLTVQDELNVPIGSDQLDTTVPSNVSTYNIMSTFIPKWAYAGVATAYASVFVEGTPVDVQSTELYIGPEDLISPVIHLLSPENVTYETESVPLVFTVNERTAWMGYSLNNLENVTIAGNTTLTSLTDGSYSIMVYANDTSGNVGSSQKVCFTILIIHDVAVIDLKCSSAEAYIGQIVNITVFAQNQGTATENFNVTTYANTTATETLTINNLSPSNQTTIIFTWNTTGFVKGNYSISAHVEEVLGEIDITDNTYVDGIVNVMSPPDIAIINIKLSKTSTGRGYSMSFNVMVRNQGDYTESFKVTAYANATITETRDVTLTSGSSTNVTFAWNTTGFAYGNYTISAYAWPLLGETATEDNALIDGWVVVTIPGDVNGDFKCDGKDNAFVAKAYDTCPGDARWIENADVNGDLKVDGKDIAIVVKYFDTHYP